MTAMRLPLAAPILALALAALPGGAASAQSGPSGNPLDVLKTPMIFYLAKGAPDACGPGCSEWIAAEGAFDTGAAARLRAFLSKHRDANLPVYFHSPGGLADRAFSVGRMMRERGMTAGVSRTQPQACRKLDEKACNALKRSGQTLAAELNAVSACNSACVYALIGATQRRVPPGARLGVHSSRLIKLYSDGRAAPVHADAARSQTRVRDAQTRKYIVEMGIDGRLFDIASKTPHESVHYLSRDEIAGLRIDPREFQETGWMLVQSRRVSVRKLFIEARGPERREYRVGVVDLSCAAPGRTGLTYVRGLASDEGGRAQALGLVVDGREMPMSGIASVAKLDFLDTGSSFDHWSRSDARDFLERVTKVDNFAIAAGLPGRPLELASATRLSTAGLSNAIGALREKCGLAEQPASTLRQ
ncbi:MAG: hypothetical protein K2Z80_24900 [Xanthobacteraceae bacterium]|nr:hypothetical protein [Xanthobacteraceae bacterium]